MLAGDPKLSAAEAMARSKRGLRSLDRVAAANPNHIGVRIQRAVGGIKSPEILNRFHISEQDFKWILENCEACDENFLAYLELGLGDALNLQKDSQGALKWWHRSADRDGGGSSKSAAGRINGAKK